jgi:diacylglycerol kinase family enzyme
VRANEFHFVNLASGGFGAQVTTNIPVALKNFFDGGAYTLSGLVQALKFVPYQGKLRILSKSMD